MPSSYWLVMTHIYFNAQAVTKLGLLNRFLCRPVLPVADGCGGNKIRIRRRRRRRRHPPRQSARGSKEINHGNKIYVCTAWYFTDNDHVVMSTQFDICKSAKPKFVEVFLVLGWFVYVCSLESKVGSSLAYLKRKLGHLMGRSEQC